jgi:hypothetical protein
MPLLNRERLLVPRGEVAEGMERDAAAGNRVAVSPHLPGRVSALLRAGLFATCANPHCGSGWLHLWRSREAPVFEEGWCCSSDCMAARVAAALSREMDGRASAGESHRHRIPLGLVLMEKGWISHQELRAALAAQRDAGAGRLGHWLVRHGSVSEDRVARALGLQWGCPVLGTELSNPEGLTALVPRLFVDAFGALPMRVAAGRLFYMGFADHLDPALALAVERMTGLQVESGLVRESVFRPAHARILEARFPAVELIEAATEPALAAALAMAVERTRPVESRLVRVHDCLWLRMWLKAQNGPVPEACSVRDLIGSAAAH